jgi:hypothetical protein
MFFVTSTTARGGEAYAGTPGRALIFIVRPAVTEACQVRDGRVWHNSNARAL